MGRMLEKLNTLTTTEKAMKLFAQRKNPTRTRPESSLYIRAVGGARGGTGTLVLDNIVHYAFA